VLSRYIDSEICLPGEIQEEGTLRGWAAGGKSEERVMKRIKQVGLRMGLERTSLLEKVSSLMDPKRTEHNIQLLNRHLERKNNNRSEVLKNEWSINGNRNAFNGTLLRASPFASKVDRSTDGIKSRQLMMTSQKDFHFPSVTSPN
jgi:translation elongation factor EF-Tu-like GTPase